MINGIGLNAFVAQLRDFSEGEIQYEVNAHKSHSAVRPFSFHLDVWRCIPVREED